MIGGMDNDDDNDDDDDDDDDATIGNLRSGSSSFTPFVAIRNRGERHQKRTRNNRCCTRTKPLCFLEASLCEELYRIQTTIGRSFCHRPFDFNVNK